MKHRVHVPRLGARDEELTVEGPEFHHTIRVVRARVGEVLELFDGTGRSASATLKSIGAESAIVSINDPSLPSRESPVHLTVACALIAPEKFELVLQKGCELGAARFLPLLTDRTEKGHIHASSRRQRWEKILLEAVKQSGRSLLPQLGDPVPFSEAVAAAGTRLLFEADGPSDRLPQDVKEVTIFIGPEGGWSERELELARSSGAIFRRLGPRRLRAETAAIAALTAVGIEIGDLGSS